jgi:hypothetical protein
MVSRRCRVDYVADLAGAGGASLGPPRWLCQQGASLNANNHLSGPARGSDRELIANGTLLLTRYTSVPAVGRYLTTFTLPKQSEHGVTQVTLGRSV